MARGFNLRFGDGMYFSSEPSKANGYAVQSEKVLMCYVVVGAVIGVGVDLDVATERVGGANCMGDRYWFDVATRGWVVSIVIVVVVCTVGVALSGLRLATSLTGRKRRLLSSSNTETSHPERHATVL